MHASIQTSRSKKRFSAVAAVLEWFAVNWLVALAALAAVITAGATVATALPTWLNRRDQKLREEPFVECTVTPSSLPGWVCIELVVRNFNPHAIYVVELIVRRPRRAALFTDSEAFSKPDVNSRGTFIASNKSPRLAARIERVISPIGTTASGWAFGSPDRPADQLRRSFYFSVVGATGPIKVKMALVCEVRGRDVRTIEIAIDRTVTLAGAHAS